MIDELNSLGCTDLQNITERQGTKGKSYNHIFRVETRLHVASMSASLLRHSEARFYAGRAGDLP